MADGPEQTGVEDVRSAAGRRLGECLEEQVAAYERLLALSLEHRAAISRADAGAVETCARERAAVAERIAALEAERQRIVAELLPAGPRTLAAILPHLPGPDRAQVEAQTRRLRELIPRVLEQSAVVQAATLAVLAHIEGLMRQVVRAAEGGGVYGPSGHPDSARVLPWSVDVTL